MILDSNLTVGQLSGLNASSADSYPIGIVKLDDQGNIQLYNKYNTDKFLYAASEVIGKNYFTDIVPCANNFLFKGRFQRGVDTNELDTEFDYTFTYKITPTKVKVRLFRDATTKSNWVFIKAR